MEAWAQLFLLYLSSTLAHRLHGVEIGGLVFVDIPFVFHFFILNNTRVAVLAPPFQVKMLFVAVDNARCRRILLVWFLSSVVVMQK